MRFYSRCEILFRFEGIPNTLASRIDLISIVHHQIRSRESPLGVANPYFNFRFSACEILFGFALYFSEIMGTCEKKHIL